MGVSPRDREAELDSRTSTIKHRSQTMNVQEARDKLFERLEATEEMLPDARPNGPTGFNLGIRRFECGSPACVVGHMADLFPDEFDGDTEGSVYQSAELLGISRPEMSDVFTGTAFEEQWDAGVFEVLEHLQWLFDSNPVEESA